ncbi:MAG: hypothetical protein H0X43_06060 [Nitrosospira sp.]|nr:hypothetical protein [Nitrosospira sp.]
MTATSRKQPARTKIKGVEEAVTSTKATKDLVAAPIRKVRKEENLPAPKTPEPLGSAKISLGIQENEKPRQHATRRKSEEKTDKTVKLAKQKKIKLVRDRYSIPETEHKEIAVLKQRCIDHDRQIKKSELLRAGLRVLVLMDDDELLAAVARIK